MRSDLSYDVSALGLPRDWEDLLKIHNLASTCTPLKLLKEGGNNRLFEFTVSSTKYALKQYNILAGGYELRMRREFDFLKHSNIYAKGKTPQALEIDIGKGLLLMSHIQGKKVLKIQNSSCYVKNAIEFIKDLNPSADINFSVNLTELPIASEAAFSIKDHVDVVENRLKKLNSINITGDKADRIRSIINPLTENWVEFVNLAKHKCEVLKISYDDYLPKKYQCISPSDFGFHNAITKENGDLCFIDFEYAGIDDPAKLICDFFEQVAVPIPIENYDYFVGEMSSHFNFDKLNARTSVLRPFYCIKWICILLNVFNKDGMNRKKFSGGGGNIQIDIFIEAQLKKAENKMNKLKKEYSLV